MLSDHEALRAKFVEIATSQPVTAEGIIQVSECGRMQIVLKYELLN